jgi:hypothetical protein
MGYVGHVADPTDLYRTPLHGWVYPEELLPNLSALSTDLTERVARLRAFLNT